MTSKAILASCQRIHHALKTRNYKTATEQLGILVGILEREESESATELTFSNLVLKDYSLASLQVLKTMADHKAEYLSKRFEMDTRYNNRHHPDDRLSMDVIESEFIRRYGCLPEHYSLMVKDIDNEMQERAKECMQKLNNFHP